MAISQALSPLEKAVPGVRIDGIRVPGCFDAFEIACRAVIGQQVSVKAANKLAGRIAERYGEKVETGIEGLDRAWPSAVAVRSLANIEDAFGELGLIKTRSRAIDAIATAIDEGELDFDIGTVVRGGRCRRFCRYGESARGLPDHIAMRTMSYPDAFLETDAGVAHALPELTPKERLALVEDCRPWRSYAVLALWDSLSG